MDTQPTRPQPQDMSAQKEILSRRRAVLKQIAELVVVRHLKVTTNHDGKSGSREHFSMGQRHRHAQECLPVANHDEVPRVFAGRGWSRHGRCKQLLYDGLVHFSWQIHPNAPPSENDHEFLVNLHIHNTTQHRKHSGLTPHRVRVQALIQKQPLGQSHPDICRRKPMQTILPSEFKRLMVLMLDGSPHVVEDMHTSGTAQTRHKLHTRLRHLTTGRLIDRVFAENERVPVASLETRLVNYSYAQGETHIFIDAQTFDEFEFSNEQLGERRWFLKENEDYKALLLDGRLLDLVLPPQISLKVVDTAPPSRTDLNSSWKEAKLETGLQIMVPLFITNAEIIRVDTAGKKYLGKETS